MQLLRDLFIKIYTKAVHLFLLIFNWLFYYFTPTGEVS